MDYKNFDAWIRKSLALPDYYHKVVAEQNRMTEEMREFFHSKNYRKYLENEIN